MALFFRTLSLSLSLSFDTHSLNLCIIYASNIHFNDPILALVSYMLRLFPSFLLLHISIPNITYRVIEKVSTISTPADFVAISITYLQNVEDVFQKSLDFQCNSLCILFLVCFIYVSGVLLISMDLSRVCMCVSLKVPKQQMAMQ